jgi:hypothetical protein
MAGCKLTAHPAHGERTEQHPTGHPMLPQDTSSGTLWERGHPGRPG